MSTHEVDLQSFVSRCRGRSFQDFVWHHQEKSQAPDRARMRAGIESNTPNAVIVAGKDLADRCLADPALLKKDCGDTASDLFESIRSRDPAVEDEHLLDALTYSALLLTEATRIRGANYLPIYVGMVIGGLLLANLTGPGFLVVAGWVLVGWGGLSVFGAIGKPR